MQYLPGDLVECGGDTARVVEDLGDRLRVWGFIGGLGPHEQRWWKSCSGRAAIKMVKRSRPEAAKAEQKTIDAIDPNVAPQDRPRLRGQNQAILERLQLGPATNDELAAMSRKYTSRISDLRKAGYRIDCERLEGGLTQYTLKN